MAPSSNEESLLWAKQLKREHGHLLKRMQDLESASSKHDDRIKTTENAAKANGSGESGAVAALAKQVQAIDSNGIKQRLDGMERDVNRKLDDVEAESEAMTLQISALQQDKQLSEEERKATLTKDKALLKRIGEVEEGLKKYEKTLDLIGKRVNGPRVEQIKEQLDGLTKQVMKEGEQMQLLGESVKALETANVELVKANKKLEAEMRKKAAKVSVEPRAKSPNASARAKEAASPDDSTSQKKKSHKWAGGGADRDIIRQGAGTFGIKPAPKPQVSKPKPTAPKKTIPQRPKIKVVPKKKPMIPRTPSESSERKSHKWAGGGADRAIIQQSLSLDSKQKSVVAAPLESPRTKAKQWAGDKKVVRAGRGWYEVEESPTPETESQASSVPAKAGRGRPKKPIPSNDGVTPAKRPRGRPRKYPRPEELQAQSAAADSTRSSVDPPPARSGLLKRTAEAAFKSSSPDPLSAPPKKPKTAAMDDDETNTKESEMFSLPVSSSPPQEPTNGSNQQSGTGNIVVPATPTAEQAAPKPPRRQIVQLNDDISTIIRHMSG